MSMYTRESSSQAGQAIDDAILELQRHGRCVMFSTLAEALPQFTWHALFRALSQLARQGHIELIPHQYDYEVIFHPVASAHSCPPRESSRERES